MFEMWLSRVISSFTCLFFIFAMETRLVRLGLTCLVS